MINYPLTYLAKYTRNESDMHMLTRQVISSRFQNWITINRWDLRLSKGLLMILTYWSETNRDDHSTDRNLMTDLHRWTWGIHIIGFFNSGGSGSGSHETGISHVSRKTGTSHVWLPLPSVSVCHRRSQTSILYLISSLYCLFLFLVNKWVLIQLLTLAFIYR